MPAFWSVFDMGPKTEVKSENPGNWWQDHLLLFQKRQEFQFKIGLSLDLAVLPGIKINGNPLGQ